MTLVEGAVICVGVPYVVKLCKNVFGSLLKGKLSLHFAFVVMCNKHFAA